MVPDAFESPNAGKSDVEILNPHPAINRMATKDRTETEQIRLMAFDIRM
jgi:hypothetical protein